MLYRSLYARFPVQPHHPGPRARWDRLIRSASRWIRSPTTVYRRERHAHALHRSRQRRDAALPWRRRPRTRGGRRDERDTPYSPRPPRQASSRRREPLPRACRARRGAGLPPVLARPTRCGVLRRVHARRTPATPGLPAHRRPSWPGRRAVSRRAQARRSADGDSRPRNARRTVHGGPLGRQGARARATRSIPTRTGRRTMRGHTYKRGTSWTVVYDEQADDTGKRRQRSKGGFGTRKQAERFLTDTLGRLDSGSYAQPSKVTVADYLTGEWLPAVEGTLRPLSVQRYRAIIRLYINPRIGSQRLQGLSPGHLNGLYSELEQAGLSVATRRLVHGVIGRALRDAERWGRVPRNVARLADPPSRSQSRAQAWTAGELRRFLEHVADDRLA